MEFIEILNKIRTVRNPPNIKEDDEIKTYLVELFTKFIEKDSTKKITVNDFELSGYSKRAAQKLLDKCFSKKDDPE